MLMVISISFFPGYSPRRFSAFLAMYQAESRIVWSMCSLESQGQQAVLCIASSKC